MMSGAALSIRESHLRLAASLLKEALSIMFVRLVA